MYFVLYDRHLNSLGETYILESWHRVQRSIDFDSMDIVGQQIPYSVEPFFVVINDRQGKQQFSGLASTPIIDEDSRKTKIILKDYLTLMNTEVIIRWANLPQQDLTLKGYLDFIMECWLEQTDVGFAKITWDTSVLADVPWDVDIPLGTDTENVLVHKLVLDAMNLYDIYCIPTLDVYRKTLKFTFLRSATHRLSIRLKDFGTPLVEKAFGDYNRAIIYSSTYEKKDEWALLQDNRIVRVASADSTKLIYPTKNRNFIADKPSTDLTETQAVYNATYEAVTGLAANRYQENIDLDVQKYGSILGIAALDFSYALSVYTEDGLYKDLPVGEIESDSKGKYIVRLGRRTQELTQEE